MLNDPAPSMLDSRGAFILHVPSLIYVWIGSNCDSIMEKDAKAAAFQVVRYEKVPGPIVSVDEGREPAEFWDAFSNAPLATNTDLAVKIGVGKRKVDAYDVDFELFYKAITGGVVPPFPSSGPGHETHLPARESNWSVLRRKFLSSTVCIIYSDSDTSLTRDADPRTNRVQVLSAEALISPHLSPSSLSSESSISSKDSPNSPSLSPSTPSSCSLTPSPVSSEMARQPPNLSVTLEPLARCVRAVSSPSKGLSRSIAERRGGFSPLKLPLDNDAPLSSGMVMNGSPAYLVSPRESLEGSSSNHILRRDNSNNTSSLGRITENCPSLKSSPVLENGQSPTLSGITSKSLDTSEPLVYRYPEMEKVAVLGREELDSQAVFLFLTPNEGKEGEHGRILYLWIGSNFEPRMRQTRQKNSRDIDRGSEIDWKRVGCDFLASMCLPNDLRIKVVKEHEPEEFLKLLNPK